MKQKKTFIITLIILVVLIADAGIAYQKLSPGASVNNLSSLQISDSDIKTQSETQTETAEGKTAETETSAETETQTETSAETSKKTESETETEKNTKKKQRPSLRQNQRRNIPSPLILQSQMSMAMTSLFSICWTNLL